MSLLDTSRSRQQASTKALYINCTRDISTTSSESHVVAAWNWENIFTLYLTSTLLFDFTHKISDTELSFLDITLRVTDDHINSPVHYKETDTHNYLHHQSSHPSHCKTALPRSQLLRLRRLRSKESDFLEKGGEMEPFFEQSGCSHALFHNNRHAIRRNDRTDVLKVFLVKRLAWSIASPVAVALPSTSAKQSVH